MLIATWFILKGLVLLLLFKRKSIKALFKKKVAVDETKAAIGPVNQ
jgi:hypothetical protein